MKISNKKQLRYLKIFDLVLGIFFLLVGIIGIFIHFQQKVGVQLLWLSNHWALINGVAFLMRSSFIFSYVVVLGVVPELFWIVDFLFMLAGQPLFGITNYWFAPDYPMSMAMLSLQHILNPFAALYGLLRFGFHKKAWLGSVIHGLAIWLIGLVLVNPSYNINCAWSNCLGALPIPDQVWQISWPLIMIAHIALVYFLMQKWFGKRKVVA